MIEVREIDVFLDGRPVLRKLSAMLPAGTITVVLGANGAGKTTLLRAMNATVPVSSGKVMLDGRSIDDYSRREIARLIAVVAQENETKFPVTVMEFVLSGRFARGGNFGWETPADISAAERAITACDLEQFASRKMNELSGGERQRVVLARALGAETRVLLLDEPTANLDLAHQAMMFRLVRQRCREQGSAAAIITHDLNLASEFGDLVLMLRNGVVIASGTPKDTLTSGTIAETYGVKVLLDANPATGKIRVTSLF